MSRAKVNRQHMNKTLLISEHPPKEVTISAELPWDTLWELCPESNSGKTPGYKISRILISGENIKDGCGKMTAKRKASNTSHCHKATA
jgi:hypothetical protein